MGWLIALAIILLIVFLPVGLKLRYDEDGFVLRLMAGPVRYRLIPERDKNGNSKKQKDSQEKIKNKKAKLGGSLKNFISFAKSLLVFLNELRRKVRIRNLKMDLVFGGSDPYDVAMQYGRGWAVLGGALPLAEEIFEIRKRDLRIDCDFDADETTITVSAAITMSLWRLVYILIRYGYDALKKYQNLKISEKAVQKNESESS